MYKSIYTKFLEQAKLIMVKEIFKECLPGGIERSVCEGPQGIFCGDGTFYILIELSVAVVYAFVKTHQSVTLKR